VKRLGSVSGASRDGTQTFPRARSSSLTPCVSASISSCGKAEAGLGRGRVRQRQGESASGRGLPAPRNFTSTDWQEPRGTRGACPKVCGAGAVGCWRRLQDLEQRRVIVVRVEVRRHVHAEEARVVVAGAKGLHLLRDLRQGGAGRGAAHGRGGASTPGSVCVCVCLGGRRGACSVREVERVRPRLALVDGEHHRGQSRPASAPLARTLYLSRASTIGAVAYCMFDDFLS